MKFHLQKKKRNILHWSRQKAEQRENWRVQRTTKNDEFLFSDFFFACVK